MIPDTRTLAIATAMTLFIQFLYLLFLDRATKTYPGFRRWLWSGAGGFVGLLLIAARGYVPDLFSIVLAQTVLGASILLLITGMMEFTGVRVPWRAFSVIAATIFVIHAVGTYAYPSYIGRTIVFAMTFAIASAVCYDLTSRRLLTVLPKGNRLLAAVFLLQTLWYLLRVGLLLTGSHHAQDFMEPSWFNASTLLAQIGFSTALIVGLVVLNAQRAEQELLQARAEINTLRGIIPICAWCKKIRHDSGSWQQIEEYVKAHADVDFSHGICPDCLPKYFEGTEASDGTAAENR